MLQKATFKVCGRKFDTCSTEDFINEKCKPEHRHTSNMVKSCKKIMWFTPLNSRSRIKRNKMETRSISFPFG